MPEKDRGSDSQMSAQLSGKPLDKFEGVWGGMEDIDESLGQSFVWQ